MEVALYHNILWSRYKGVVFSELHKFASESLRFEFKQIAETDQERQGLIGIDLRFHEYPYELLFSGAYFSVPRQLRAWRLFRSVWESPADLVLIPGYHLFEYWCMLFACVLRRKRRAVFCDSTIYDQPQTTVKSVAKRVFFYLCDGFFAYGERAKAYLMHHGAPADRIFERCQAAALPPQYDSAKAIADRIANAKSSPNARFLFVGRLVPEKDLHTLLNAFTLIRQRGFPAELILVGGGPMENELRATAAELRIAEYCTFTGSQELDFISQEYARATCLVLPSRSEAWGLVANEALSYGCPVVVSHRCGCAPELVAPSLTGLVFESGDAEDLADKLIRSAQLFADVGRTAENCVQLISSFRPKIAAAAILRGCYKILRVRGA